MLALAATPLFAQQDGLGVTASFLAVFPSGKFDKIAGTGFGGLGGVELGGDGFGVTARSGYVRLGERSDVVQSMVPILGGVKLSTDDGGFYIAGEVGGIITNRNYSGSNPLSSDSKSTNPGWSIGIGSVAEPLDLRFSFNAWDARHLSQSMSIGLSLGLILR